MVFDALPDHIKKMWQECKQTGDKRAEETKLINSLVRRKPNGEFRLALNAAKFEATHMCSKIQP